MALTRVSPALFQVSNNITSVTVGGSANTISLTFDASGVITSASNNAVSVANTAITGNIISSQIASVNGSVITANTIANSAIQTGAVENYMNAAGLGFGMRNRIINGAMVIDQRNAGASVTPTNGQYTLDRYDCVVTQASKFTVQQNAGSVTPPVGFANYLGVTSSSAYSVVAGDAFVIRQTIEGYNIADLSWGTASASTVTLSFKVYSSLTGTFGGALSNSTRSYPFTYTVSSANTWTSISITIAGDTSGTWATTNGAGIQVRFGLGAGSTFSGTAGSWSTNNYFSATGSTSVVGTNGATFYITGVQLEKGSTATSFDYRPYGTELSLCQRYFQLLQGGGGRWGSTQANFIYTTVLPVSMRASPTLSVQGTVTIENYAGNNATVGSVGSTVGLYPNGIGYVVLALSGASGSPVQGYGGELYVGSSSSGIATSAEL